MLHNYLHAILYFYQKGNNLFILCTYTAPLTCFITSNAALHFKTSIVLVIKTKTKTYWSKSFLTKTKSSLTPFTVKMSTYLIKLK